MKQFLRYLTAFTLLVLCTKSADAQINSVDYQLKYDTATCMYDVYMIVNSGQALAFPDRVQGTAQVSIVVPTGTYVETDNTSDSLVGVNPRYNNIAGGSLDSVQWTSGSQVINPPDAPGFDFYGFTPVLQAATAHNTLISGDTVKLFSVFIGPTVDCGQEIRLYENGSDPGPTSTMGFSDFSNAYRMSQAGSNVYSGNSNMQYPPSPLLLNAPPTCAGGVEIDLTASTSTCQGNLTYSWTGPNGFTSTAEDVSIVPSTPANAGVYKVVVTDEFGCMDSLEIDATGKPNAGLDITLCAGALDTLVGTNPNTGTWDTIGMNNPPGLIRFTALTLGESVIEFNDAASGDYTFVYTNNGGCADTMVVTVDPQPIVSIDAGDEILCITETTQLNPSTGGTWVSADPSVATVTASGFVTAVGSGLTTFTFESTNSGCTATTAQMLVNDRRSVSVDLDTVCIDGTAQATPSTGGTWSSLDVSIATINPASGIITGVAEGTAQFVFLDAVTGCYSDTLEVEITDKPIVQVENGQDSICINGFTQMLPSSGGAWTSSDPTIATISNSGLVTALRPGIVTFTFSNGSCSSDPSAPVTVFDDPTVAITGFTNICVGLTTTLSPTTGGTWVSNNTSVATVDANTGVVTAVGQGLASFTFTDAVTGCSATTGFLTVDGQPIASADDNALCIGSTTFLVPDNSNGSWTAFDPSIVDLTDGFNVEAYASGEARFIYTDFAGCQSDTVRITVDPGETVGLTDLEICVNETTQLTTTGGVGAWRSSDNSIATVTNTGQVLGINPGVVTFQFQDPSTGCFSDPTPALTVNALPVIQFNNAPVCIGESVPILPNSGGTWVSSDPAVATITNAGVITAVGAGTASFTFTSSSASGCSATSSLILVNETPELEISLDEVCIGEANSANSLSGSGAWSSSNTSVATISNNGDILAIGAGAVVFTFTDDNTGCSNTIGMTVNPSPDAPVIAEADGELCIGETTTATITPAVAGSWVSSDPAVATIDAAGVITAVGQGVVTFRFNTNTGCDSEDSDVLTVNAPPTIDEPSTTICVGSTMQLVFTGTGTWTSTDPAVATVDNAGLVTAVAAGTVQFQFEDGTTGCVSALSELVTVEIPPFINVTDFDICIGESANATPSIGGSWSSSDPAILQITNNGQYTGLSAGKAVITFTNAAGCASEASDTITVNAGQTVSIDGDTDLCIGESTNLLPATGGTWTSRDENVATVTSTGIVTAVGSGSTTFYFTDASGCRSEDTAPVIVNNGTAVVNPQVSTCIGGTVQLQPSTGGTWASSDDNVATVDNNGLVTAVNFGTVTFTFTDGASGCVSEQTDPLEVTAPPTVSIDLTALCIGGTAQASPSSGGTWSSSDPNIATINNDGVITAVGTGDVTFQFIDASGCSAAGSTSTLSVSACKDPDFNVTYVNVPVPGDVSTNDDVPGGTTYETPVLLSSPAGSVKTISMNDDGTYTFEADMVGVYVYEVPVCETAVKTGCGTTELVITVLDYLEPDNRPVANVDYGTTAHDTPITLLSLDNDRCVVTTGCSLDPGSVTIISNPSNGTVSVDPATGNTTYTPTTGFTGYDILRYEVCVTGEPGNCAQANQIILVNSPTASNTTQAADDFTVTPQGTPVSGNVSNNDSDPEGDIQMVTAFTTSNAAGTLVMGTDGSYTFTPNPTFFGPVEFPYTTTDDNANPATADATLHILVVRDLTVNIRMYLSGALLANGGEQAIDGRPLMRADLRVSPFSGANVLPTVDPYNPANIGEFDHALGYTGFGLLDGFVHVGAAALEAEFQNAYPTAFDATGEDAIVDWVFVELRDKSDYGDVVATRSAFVQRDGDVVELDGVSGLRFPDLMVDDYYVVVSHRNHLGAMSANAQTPQQLLDLVDFTDQSFDVFDHGTNTFDWNGNAISGRDYTGLAQYEAKFGYNALWGGDFRHDGKVKFDATGNDQQILIYDVLGNPNNTEYNSNYDFSIGYLQGDFDLNSKSKLDSPNDDTNAIYLRVLFYPLNTTFVTNFDLFFEQVPNRN